MNEQEQPQVGMGATLVVGSDRKPFTIIKVSKSGKSFDMQADEWERADKNGMSECQSYTYGANPNGEVVRVRLTKRGWKREKTRQPVWVGIRKKYFDFSF